MLCCNVALHVGPHGSTGWPWTEFDLVTLVFLWCLFQEISKVQLYDTASVPVLHILYEEKKNALCGRHVCSSVCLSVTKSQQLSGSYEIWCTTFFYEKYSSKREFRENRLIEALLHLKVSCNFYTRFTYFVANSGEILCRRSAHYATEQLGVSWKS